MTRTFALLAFTVLLSACGPGGGTPDAHGPTAAADFERGPHRGRMLREGDLAIELTIFEEGVPPEFHVYAYDDDKPIPPQQLELSVELTRLGGKISRFAFTPERDYLKSAHVLEPHSFDVAVTATHAGRTATWKFASYEGRVQIAPAAAEAAGLEVVAAGPATLSERLELTGAIQANPARLARVRARFAGVVRDVRKGQGDPVRAGDVLATVQANESLQVYSVVAPIGGAVLERNVVSGEATGDEPLFVVGDLSKVWAELDVFGRDLIRVRPGQRVSVVSLEGGTTGEGAVSVISPLATHSSQSVRARVVLDNAARAWRPGQFVHGVVTVAESQAPLAVRNSALQRFRDFTVVFAQVGDTYEVRMLELGKTDGTWTEVLGGLEPGERYVAANSFLVKADIEKSGASHDH